MDDTYADYLARIRESERKSAERGLPVRIEPMSKSEWVREWIREQAKKVTPVYGDEFYSMTFDQYLQFTAMREDGRMAEPLSEEGWEKRKAEYWKKKESERIKRLMAGMDALYEERMQLMDELEAGFEGWLKNQQAIGKCLGKNKSQYERQYKNDIEPKIKARIAVINELVE